MSTDSSLMVLTLKDSLNSSLFSFSKVRFWRWIFWYLMFSHCVKLQSVKQMNKNSIQKNDIFCLTYFEFEILICKIYNIKDTSWYKVIFTGFTTNKKKTTNFIEWLLDDDSVNLTGSVCTNSCGVGVVVNDIGWWRSTAYILYIIHWNSWLSLSILFIVFYSLHKSFYTFFFTCLLCRLAMLCSRNIYWYFMLNNKKKWDTMTLLESSFLFDCEEGRKWWSTI